MEQAGQLQRPFDLLLAVRLQVGPQGIEKLPGIGVVLAAEPERDWAICMIWAMASVLDSKLFSFSSNSAIDADPAFLRYFWMALLMRCTSSAPPGLCMI